MGVQLFPRFHVNPLDRPAQVSVGGLLLALGIVLRVIGQPLLPSATLRPAVLVVSGVLQLVGVLLAVHAFAKVIRDGVQPTLGGWRFLLPATMGGSLLVGLVLNLVACVELAGGAFVVPFTQDEALTHLELWGFASSLVLAVSGRIFPKFLLLQHTQDTVLRAALSFWAIGSLGVPLVWLVLADVPPPHAPRLRLHNYSGWHCSCSGFGSMSRLSARAVLRMSPIRRGVGRGVPLGYCLQRARPTSVLRSPIRSDFPHP